MFSWDNIDNSLEAQKEELIWKILKLGGDNYTAKDLRRDLLKMEIEDNREHLLIDENGIENEGRGNRRVNREGTNEV